MLYKSNLSVVEVRLYENKNIEYLCVDLLSNRRERPTRFLCTYIPPILSNNSNVISNLCSCIEMHKPSDSFFLLGDFNMPCINWRDLVCKSSARRIFLDFCIERSLLQLVTEPTTVQDSLLDLILCNDSSLRRLLKIDVLPPLSPTCDHCVIQFEFLHENNGVDYCKIPRSFCYERGDYDAINLHLATIDWENIFDICNNDIQRFYDFFLDTILPLIEKFVPKSTFKMKLQQPKYITRLAKKKKDLYRKQKLDPNLKKAYKDLSLKYKDTVLAWHSRVEQNICESGSSRNFYKYANKKLKSTETIAPLKSQTGDYITDDLHKAEMFNDYFQSVFLQDKGQKLNLRCKVKSDETLDEIVISQNAILKILSELNPKKSSTPEAIPSFVLKKIGTSISKFLYILFNASLQSGVIPHQWKTALIVPVFKKGSRYSVNNYRPISLTSSICRILERILCDIILSYLLEHNLISQQQHGFLPGRSTVTQLIEAINKWATSYISNEVTDVVYTDLSKAFDRVSYSKLISVLESYGICGKLVCWITHFLQGRNQRVNIRQSTSEPRDIFSGVPQGSVIGPLLFLIYVDDITKVCSNQSGIYLFADDAKVYSSSPTDLQMSLNNIDTFLKSRQLSLAVEKCEKITFSKEDYVSTFSIGNTQVRDVTSVKDLGITISDNLKWDLHINQVKGRAFQRCHHILKAFHSRNVWTYVKAYKSFVRPIVEYGSVVWSPYLKEDKISIESVQRFFTKKICAKSNIPFSSYEDRLYKLGMDSLESRRIKADLLMTYKIVHGLVNIPFNDLFEFYHSPYQTRRHRYCLAPKKVDTNFENNFYRYRTVQIWNKLPKDIVESTTLDSFKLKVKKLDLNPIATLIYVVPR